MENFRNLNKFAYPCNAQNNNFYNSIICCCRVIQSRRCMRFYCGNCIIYVTVESGGSMRMVNTMVMAMYLHGNVYVE